MAASLASHFNKLFLPLLLLLLHFGCFIFHKNNNLPRKSRKSSNSPFTPQKALSSSWSFIKRVFSNSNRTNHNTTTTSFSSPRSSQHSMIIPISDSDPLCKRRSESISEFGSLCENPFLPLRNDIFPCPSCGEIFQKPNLLEDHQSTNHAVTELRDGDDDSGKNIVWIIFNTGWANRPNKFNGPKVNRILKIHNGPKILSRFEDYREKVKAKAAKNGAVFMRCVADGNELLRFHCTTLVCSLGQNGNSSICNQSYCSACGIIRAGFSPKLDGISTLSSSWRAHVAVPGDVEAEFGFMNVKRAMLICRVIAGRVGCDPMVVMDKEDSGFDSLVGPRGRLDDDELLVFNPRAVLPCFLIVYSV